MRPLVMGIVAAAAVIVAFIAGTQIEYATDGPAEEIGEKIDELADSQ